MEIRIRKAAVEDAAAIAYVQVESWRSTYAGIIPEAYIASLNVEVRTEKWKALFDSGKAHFFVAEDESGIFGFVCGGELSEPIEGYDGELRAIYLLRERQRQGVGRLLAQTLAKALRAEGCKSIVAWVLEENPAVSFYQRLGGVEIARKLVEIGGAPLSELAFGWPTLDSGS
jgi:ribosomal protein S18 acetylase RimI-like enzyme